MSDTYLTRQTLLKKLTLDFNEDSWEEFVHFYGRFIASVIKTMGVSDSDIDDVQQQVLVRIWKSIERFDLNRERGSFRSWVYKIAQNTTLNFISKNKNKNAKLDMLKVDYEDQYSNPEINEIIEDQWNRHISKMAFENISAVVSDKLIDAFVSHVKGESADITAERLGIEKETVYIYRNRMKEKLRAEITNLKDLLE